MGRRKNKNKTDKISSSNVPGSKYHGLENQGATCYLNSVLQVLFITKDFRAAVFSSASSDPNCIDGHLSTLFKTLQDKTAKTQAITKHLDIRRVNEQDDAAECFEKILSCSSPNASQIFEGQMTYRNTCSKCHTATYDDQSFWSLPLPLVGSDKQYCVMAGIKSFFEESNISGENQVYCNQCNAKADATIKAEMKQHPQVLTLLMKRFKFDYSDMKYVKIGREVEIPLILPIPHNGEQSQKYELYACVQHSGDLRHGHYTVNIKPQDDEKWYNFNDATVTSIPQVDYKRSSNAYLLFYRKCISEASTSEGPKNDTQDKNEQREQDMKSGKRKVDEEAEAADSQKIDSNNIKTKRQKAFKGGKDSKTVNDDNCGTSVSQKSRETVENQQSKRNHVQQCKKDICEKFIGKPSACSSEEQNGEEGECKRGDDQHKGKLADVSQDVSGASTSEAPKHHNQDTNEQHKQDVKTGERREGEGAEASDSQKTDQSNSKIKGKRASKRDEDSKTLANDNSCTSVNHKSRKQSSKNQGQNSIVKVQDDGRLQQRNVKNPCPGNSHRKKNSSQINQKYSHQVVDRRDSREAVENQQSEQNHDLLNKKNICKKFISNPSVCCPEEQKREEEECKRGDDQELTREQSESHFKENEVKLDSGKLADVSQGIKVSTAVCNLNTSEQHEEESNEKKVVNVREDQDRGQQGSDHIFKKISLCNDQTQKKGEDGVSKNTSMNNQERKQVISNSAHTRHEYCGESEGNQDDGKSKEVCPNELREDQRQEMNTQVMKETKEDPEAKCDPKADSSESKEHGSKYIHGKVENNLEMKSLTESSAENREKVLLGAQIGVDSDKSHQSDRKGKKSKKGQNKQNKSILFVGLPSPRKKNH